MHSSGSLCMFLTACRRAACRAPLHFSSVEARLFSQDNGTRGGNCNPHAYKTSHTRAAVCEHRNRAWETGNMLDGTATEPKKYRGQDVCKNLVFRVYGWRSGAPETRWTRSRRGTAPAAFAPGASPGPRPQPPAAVWKDQDSCRSCVNDHNDHIADNKISHSWHTSCSAVPPAPPAAMLKIVSRVADTLSDDMARR